MTVAIELRVARMVCEQNAGPLGVNKHREMTLRKRCCDRTVSLADYGRS
jgi:hypothetical protein